MTPLHILLILFTVLALAAGQVLFKLASAHLPTTLSDWRSLFHPTLLIALTVYGVATIAWLMILRQTPLRLAYPFVALAFLIVPVLAHFLLKEPLHWNTFAGGALILAGVVVSSYR